VPFPIADGGTNATGSGYTTNGLFIYTGSTFATTALGASGTVLTGTGVAPAFSSSPTLTGLTLTGLAAGSNNSLVFAATTGALNADNTKLIWDSVNSRLSVKSILRLLGSTAGNVDLQAPSTGGALVITLPAVEGTVGQTLKVTASSAGAITLGYYTPITSAVTSINGQTNTAQLLTFSNTGATTIQFSQVSDNENRLIIPDAGTGVSRGSITNIAQTIQGPKSLTDTFTLASGTTAAAPEIFSCSSCALLTSPVAGAFEYDGTNYFLTPSLPSVARKRIAFTDAVGTASVTTAINISGNLSGDITSSGMVTSYSATVPLSKGGTGSSLSIGSAGMFMRSDGVSVSFSADGSSLTGLNASNISTGTLSTARLSGVELTANKNAASGYAGLDGSSKITASQIQEVIGVADLTDYNGKSGSGTTAIGATITTPSDGQILTYQSGVWVNSAPGASTAHNLLDGSVHTDTVAGSVANGDLVVGNATPKWTRLGIGSSGQYLKVVSGAPAWSNFNLSTDVGSSILGVGNGGTGITFGVAGGVLYFNNSTTTIASSAALTANAVVLGGGSGSPTVTSIGTANQILRIAGGGGAPDFGSIDLSQSAAVGSSVLQPANGGIGSAVSAAYKMLPVDYPNAPTTTDGFTYTANQVKVYRFYLEQNITVNKLIFSLSSIGSGTRACAVAIYTGDGNTKKIDSGAITPTVTGNQTVTVASVALTAGYYYLAWTASGTTAPIFNAITGSIAGENLLNAGTVHFGTAANSASTSVMPSTLGTITAASNAAARNIVIAKLQN
jgi:hypothetical protein